jgi:hypothetical protein
LFGYMPHGHWRAVLILVLAVAAIAAAGFLWIEYTVPGVWPPWIGPVETPDRQ